MLQSSADTAPAAKEKTILSYEDNMDNESITVAIKTDSDTASDTDELAIETKDGENFATNDVQLLAELTNQKSSNSDTNPNVDLLSGAKLAQDSNAGFQVGHFDNDAIDNLIGRSPFFAAFIPLSYNDKAVNNFDSFEDVIRNRFDLTTLNYTILGETIDGGNPAPGDSTSGNGQNPGSGNSGDNPSSGGGPIGSGEPPSPPPPASPAPLPSLFDSGHNVIDFQYIIAGTYLAYSYYDAFGGNDIVTLPQTIQAALDSGFIISSEFHGSNGNDVITGGDLDDIIHGDRDNDILSGNSGHDKLYGGDGYNDQLFGGNGNDTLRDSDGITAAHGGDGNDYISIEFAADWDNDGNTLTNPISKNQITGGWGDDTIDITLHNSKFFVDIKGDDATPNAQEDGDDIVSLHGSYAGSEIDLGNGNDEFYGGAGKDSVLGGKGNDKLYGGLGTDKLNGGDGDDIIVGGKGADTMTGGAGHDIFKWNAGDYDGSADIITDYNSAQDTLDIHDLLTGFSDHSDIRDFMKITKAAAGKSYLMVDFDGAANGSNWYKIAELQHSTKIAVMHAVSIDAIYIKATHNAILAENHNPLGTVF